MLPVRGEPDPVPAEELGRVVAATDVGFGRGVVPVPATGGAAEVTGGRTARLWLGAMGPEAYGGVCALETWG